MTEDEEIDYAELMSEPPGGINRGRKKSTNGRWVALEPADFSMFEEIGKPLPVTDEFSMPALQAKHGLYAYQRLRCRCVDCKAIWAAYMRNLRKRAR